MNVGAVLVADLQTPEAVEPGAGAFNHPAVAAQSVLGLDERRDPQPNRIGNSPSP